MSKILYPPTDFLFSMRDLLRGAPCARDTSTSAPRNRSLHIEEKVIPPLRRSGA